MIKNQKWTKERILKVASEVKRRVDLPKAAKRAAVKIGIESELESVLPPAERIFRTDEECILTAQKYESKTELKEKDAMVYGILCRRNLINVACSHMISTHESWTEDKIREKALLFQNRTLFAKAYSGAVKTARRLGIFDDACSHMPRTKLPPMTENVARSEALKYTDRTEFSSKAKTAYLYIVNNGLCDSLDGMTTQHVEYTYDEIVTEAKKHKTRSSFDKAHRGLYRSALNRDITEAFSHMIRPEGTGGFKDDRSGLLYYVKINNMYKIGITNRTIEKRFCKDLSKITIIKTWNFDKGVDARNKEREILQKYSHAKYIGEPLLVNGNTEIFTYDVLKLDVIY